MVQSSGRGLFIAAVVAVALVCGSPVQAKRIANPKGPWPPPAPRGVPLSEPVPVAAELTGPGSGGDAGSAAANPTGGKVVGGNGKPFIWQPGTYKYKVIKGLANLRETTEIGWAIPPAWQAGSCAGPSAQGSGALRPLLARGGDWSTGVSDTFDSGWGNYRFPFGLYATHLASGNFNAGAHVNTLHGAQYPAEVPFFKVVEESPTQWRVFMDFWVDGNFDDLEMTLECVTPVAPAATPGRQSDPDIDPDPAPSPR